MIFLSSIPRSGSTLLSSLLNQRSDAYASPTSNLCDTMAAAVMSWEQNPMTRASGGTKDDLYRLLKGIADTRYDTDKTVFDKGRGWSVPRIMETMIKVQGDMKIVATVRPIAECLASFVKIAAPDNVREFCKNSELVQHLFNSYHNLKAGYEAYPDNILLVEYNNLVTNTQTEMDRVADFTGMERFAHDLKDVPPSDEQDEVWNIENLHRVHKVVRRSFYSARSVLGKELWDHYQGGEFWNDKPEPVREKDLLDIQLEASLCGEFKRSAQLSAQLLKERPNCNRVAFNAGWYALRSGHLQKGHELMDRGRSENIFGNQFGSNQPKWDGKAGGTVLLNLEGGLGDQIHGYRYAFDIQARGNKVVVACSPELASIFAEDFITVQHEAACGVYHDYWVPSMSAVHPLSYEYKDLSGEPYISTTANVVPGRIGIRWSGNPQFEHEQYRQFPPELLFQAIQGLNTVSLQRDDGIELKPDWMPQADVSDWQATQRSISECELVITSCTSVAHLAAAMGVPTWIIVPVLSYYLWALPGETSPWYDSVKLFRQQKYEDWSDPFEQIKEELECSMHTLKIAV